VAIDPIAAKVLTRAAVTTGAGTGAAALPSAPDAQGGTSFGASLERLVNHVNETNASANVAIDGMLAGTTDVHEAMIAIQRADHTLQFSVQVRNKLMNAYQEIMRMPV
jgi:flagellar hook-basal body complex protein FliE